METRKLGNSDMQISRIGVGAWAMGGGNWEWGWGPQEDDDSIRAIHAALDAGMNWIDTAAVYGLGHSEEVVAKALKGRAARPYIFTKCSMVWDESREIGRSLKAASIRKELENSLRRLNVSTIDLYQIHWPVPDEEIEEGWTEMARLKDEGKVRYIGVSNFNVKQMKRAHAISPITSLQPPYSMLKRSGEDEILPFAEQHNIGAIVYSPMYSGLLTGAMTKERAAKFAPDDWRRRDPNFQEPRLSRNLQLIEVLREIGKHHRRTPGEVAIAWTLKNSAVTAAIVGVRNAEQVAGISGAGDLHLSSEETNEIEDALREKVAA
jgi:aryl-alcohol dehydrogenase-like predicted oxidoreductase